MDLNKVRTFIEVVDSGSITMAANRLLRSQQAISLQLQILEDELDLCLFDRQGPKIILTQIGEKLYQDFKPKLLSMENSVLELKSEKQQASGIIRIGSWMEQAVNYLPNMIRIFKEKYPLVEFHLQIMEDTKIEHMLKNNLIDFGLQVYCQDKKLFKCESIYRQPLIPVISRSFLETNGTPETINDTLDLPLLDYSDEYSAYNTWIKENSRNLLSLARKKIRTITTSNNVILKQLVLQGLGFGFLHQDSISEELKNKKLIPLISNSIYQNIYVDLDVVYKRKNVLGHIHKAFLKLLREQRDNWNK